MLQKDKEQGWQDRGTSRGTTTLQAIDHGWTDEPGDLREAISSHPLIGILDRRITKTCQGGIAVTVQIQRTWRQAANYVLCHIIECQLTNRCIVGAFMNVLQADQGSSPGNATVTGIQNTDLGLFVRQH